MPAPRAGAYRLKAGADSKNSSFFPKCRIVFEEYFYAGKTVDVIADNMGLTVSTVRVQLKNATDRLKQTLKHLLLFFIC